MKDIDFDELDRAVSSVLGQGAVKDEPVTAASPEPSSDDGQGSSSVSLTTDKPEPATVEPEASSPAPSTKSTPSLAVKRRGKFMDVMHPSADMAPVSQSRQPIRPLSPISPTVAAAPESIETTEATPSGEVSSGVEDNAHEPTASLDETTVQVGAEPAPIEALLPDHVQDASTNQDDSENTAEPTTETAIVSEEKETEAEVTPSIYVDPLSVNEQKETDASDGTDAEPEVSSTDVDKPEANETQVESPPAPSPEPTAQESSTPFLTDTNVDKRPLGAFVGQEQAAATVETPAGAPLQPAMAMPGDRQSAPAVPLPRELQPDVVEVESVQEPEATAPAATADDGRVEGHPLFDTSTYHEPIAAVHGHGMAAWLKWMIGLLLCLVVGAGVGYFLFAAGL